MASTGTKPEVVYKHRTISTNLGLGQKRLGLTSHASTFFGAVAALLSTFLTVVNVMSVTFYSASIANVSAQTAELLCELAIH